MPEYSSTTITPADGVQLPAQNGAISGNFMLSALRSFILASKGQANGLAGLGSDGKLDPSQVPDSLDDVLVYATRSNFPATGTAGKLYITADDNKMYRWDDTLSTPDYVVLSVDLSAYATKAEVEAADTNLKNALDATNARVENLEQEHGSYQEVDVKSVYTIQSGKAKNWIVDRLRGVGRVNNQLVADNKIHQTITGQNGTYVRNEFGNFNLIQGHKYLVAMIGTAPRVNGLIMTNDYSQRSEPTSALSSVLIDLTSASGVYSVWTIETQDTSYDFDIIIRDVTVYFNGTIPSDADTIAEIQQNYPWLLLPSDYGTQVRWTRYEGIKSTSPYNIWNEKWELGRYDSSTGEKISASTSIRSKDFTYVEPNDRFYCLCPSIGMRIFFYGINKNFVSTQILYNTSDFTIASGVYYFTFQTGNDGNPITTYGNDIQFCPYSYTEERDTYHHHLLDTLTLSSPIELKGVGTCIEGYDPYTGELDDGKFGQVNLANLNWVEGVNSGHYYYASNDLMSVVKKPQTSYHTANIICSTAEPTYVSRIVGSDGCVGIDTDGTLYWTPQNSLSSASPSGTLYYEKATYTPSSPIAPINDMIATEAGGTIESVLTNPIDDSMTLGYLNL